MIPAQTPTVCTAVAFIDGQNLYRKCKDAFGYTYPNYDVLKLAAAVCKNKQWVLKRVHFYTGVPTPAQNPFWHAFWNNKVAQLGRDGVQVYTRSLVDRTIVVDCGNCKTQFRYPYTEEKGIDVRLSVDVVAQAHLQEYDVALIFSQDQDLAEIVPLVHQVATQQKRWIKLASAYPSIPRARGIDKTDWIPFDKVLYDSCIDPRDYRPKRTP